MTNTRITDPEVVEHRYPVRVERFGIRAGSRRRRALHRGGDGAVRELTFLEPMSLSVLTQHRAEGPYGVAGGLPGAPGRQRVIRASGEVLELGSVDGTRGGARRPAAAGDARRGRMGSGRRGTGLNGRSYQTRETGRDLCLRVEDAQTFLTRRQVESLVSRAELKPDAAGRTEPRRESRRKVNCIERAQPVLTIKVCCMVNRRAGWIENEIRRDGTREVGLQPVRDFDRLRLRQLPRKFPSGDGRHRLGIGDPGSNDPCGRTCCTGFPEHLPNVLGAYLPAVCFDESACSSSMRSTTPRARRGLPRSDNEQLRERDGFRPPQALFRRNLVRRQRFRRDEIVQHGTKTLLPGGL